MVATAQTLKRYKAGCFENVSDSRVSSNASTIH
jgi:hypothetical protein